MDLVVLRTAHMNHVLKMMMNGIPVSQMNVIINTFATGRRVCHVIMMIMINVYVK
jgi:hypothetical protein